MRRKPVLALLIAASSLTLVACASSNGNAWQSSPPVTDQRHDTLSTASAQIDAGAFEQALATLAPLVEANPNDPTALELVGKAHLRSGSFSDAASSFQNASENAETQDDRDRAADLANFARGLDSYAQGNIADARAAFASIANQSLRDTGYQTTDKPVADMNNTPELSQWRAR